MKRHNTVTDSETGDVDVESSEDNDKSTDDDGDSKVDSDLVLDLPDGKVLDNK